MTTDVTWAGDFTAAAQGIREITPKLTKAVRVAVEGTEAMIPLDGTGQAGPLADLERIYDEAVWQARYFAKITELGRDIVREARRKAEQQAATEPSTDGPALPLASE